MQEEKIDEKEAAIERKFKNRLIWIIVVGIIVIAGAWFLNYTAVLEGAFGDKFGVVNSLFSGFAFAGIIITIYMQKHELELQRRELKETRNVFKKQSQIMTDQQNDNTFFNLLQNHRQLVDSLKTSEINYFKPVDFIETISGHQLLKRIADDWRNYFRSFSDSYLKRRIIDLDLYKFKNNIQIISSFSDVNTFYRELLNIHLFINSAIAEDRRFFYLSTLSNSLSNAEAFIFDSVYTAFPLEQNDIVWPALHYSEEKFVDFKQCELPTAHVYEKHIEGRGREVWIDHDSFVTSAELVILWNKSESGKKELFEILNLPLNEFEKVNITKFNIENCLKKSKLSIDQFPYLSKIELSHFTLVFKVFLEFQEREILLAFEAQLSSRKTRIANDVIAYQIDRFKVNETSDEVLDIIIKKAYATEILSVSDATLAKIPRINSCLRSYFEDNPTIDKACAEDLVGHFKRFGVFGRDISEASPIVDLLSELDSSFALHLIPYVVAEKSSRKIDWFFERLKP